MGRCSTNLPHQVLSCATLEGVQEIFRAEIARHGYASSAYRTIAPTGMGTKPQFLFRNWPGEWARQFKEIGSATGDNFAVNEARRQIAPFTWSDARAGRSFSAGEDRMWKEAQAFGWRDAFVLPVHGPRGYLATVSMTSMARDLDLSPRQRLRLQMIALVVHERCSVLSGTAMVDSGFESLSARELECLHWVAAGKTDWEIGVILSLSIATVKFHLDRARKKLGASTRAQAVARLLLSESY